MTSEVSREKYEQDFSGEQKREKALELAHDIRKFEIELYWKRATYFWVFIAGAFGGYVALRKEEFIIVLGVTSIGFLVSVAWYFVNRASAYWQKNWEAHVDSLEDDVSGPLHKTIVNPKIYKLSNLTGPYRFSPSKINTILAFGVSGIWPLLMFLACNKEFGWDVSSTKLAWCAAGYFILIGLLLAHESKAKGESKDFKFVRRDTEIGE